MNLRCLAVFCTVFCVSQAAGAARILHASVQRLDDGYRIDAAVLLEGELSRVERIITDYGRFARLSPSVVRSRILSGRSGVDARVEVVLRPCVLVIFCKTITKVTDVHVDRTGRRMRYITIPGLSDFSAGMETVTLSDQSAAGSARVRFVYSAVLAPKFFVPPFVGPWLIRRQIIEDLKTSGGRVERLVRDTTF